MKKDFSPKLIEQAKEFHKLHQKGYSVAEAAKELNISNYTLYKKLDDFAIINGVANRWYYIKDYKKEAVPRCIVKKLNLTKSANDDLQLSFDDSENKLEESKKVDTIAPEGNNKQKYKVKTIADCYDSVLNHSAYLLGILEQEIATHVNKVKEFKEEKI